MKAFVFLFMLGSLQLVAQHDSLDGKIRSYSYAIHYSTNDSFAAPIDQYVDDGLTFVAGFLKKDFKNTVEVFLFPSRNQLNQQWQKAWGMPTFNSECWMVGSGVESRLDLLSPMAWKKEACEHDPNDWNEIKRLVFHELTHVLHSDYNRSPAFDSIHNIDWLVEGLATYVSGQLDEERLLNAVSFVRSTGGPEQLSMFWKGENKYGLSGSMVAYIDAKYGRNTLSSLLEYNTVEEVLKALDVTEKELIHRWKEALLNAK